MPKFTFLGTGTSTGLPMLACDCPVCTSDDPHDHRWRASAHITDGEKSVIIDASPEFRLQCLRAGIKHLDALFLTHDHADHIAGLDDVRSFTFRMNHSLPVYADQRTAEIVRERFRYVWNENHVGGGLPKIEIIEITSPVTIGSLTFEPLTVMHGPTPVTAYRIGNLAYVTDVSYIADSSMDRLQRLDILILDAVRFTPHPTHYTVEEALEVIKLLKPQEAWLTHLNHEISHAEESPRLPENVHLAYDGLQIDFTSNVSTVRD